MHASKQSDLWVALHPLTFDMFKYMAAVNSMFVLLPAVHYHKVYMSAKDNRAENLNQAQAHLL